MSRSPTTQPLTRRERRSQARVERPAPARKKIVRRAPTERPRWQSGVVLTSIGALVVGAVIIFAAGGLKIFGGSSELVTPDTSYAGLTVDGTTVGSPTAPVVMKVYADFQCTACRQFYTTELPQILRDLVQPGFLRIESTDIDIIDSYKQGGTETLELAAGGYCAAQQNKYWAYHDLVFWNGDGENQGYYTPAFIDRVATAAGLDMTAFHACQARSDIRQPIRDATAAASKAGISSTPTLVINGQQVSGVPSYAQLKSVILQLASQATPNASGSPAPSGAAPSPVPSTAPSPGAS